MCIGGNTVSGRRTGTLLQACIALAVGTFIHNGLRQAFTGTSVAHPQRACNPRLRAEAGLSPVVARVTPGEVYDAILGQNPFLTTAAQATALLSKVEEGQERFDDWFRQGPQELKPNGNTTEHADRLVKDFLAGGQSYLMTMGSAPYKGSIIIRDTPFQKLLSKVMSSTSVGTRVAYAEPHVGKSFAASMLTAMPPPMGNTRYILVQDKLDEAVLRLFRAPTIREALKVAGDFMLALRTSGQRLVLVFDNVVDTEKAVKGDPGEIILSLTRLAAQHKHLIVVTTQTLEAATELKNLNGGRIRFNAFQDPHDAQSSKLFRWSLGQARAYALSEMRLRDASRGISVVQEAVLTELDDVLNETEKDDAIGGWTPIDIEYYLYES